MANQSAVEKAELDAEILTEAVKEKDEVLGPLEVDKSLAINKLLD